MPNLMADDGLIGDREELFSCDGSIDRLRLPCVDFDVSLAALVGARENGRRPVSPPNHAQKPFRAAVDVLDPCGPVLRPVGRSDDAQLPPAPLWKPVHGTEQGTA